MEFILIDGNPRSPVGRARTSAPTGSRFVQIGDENVHHVRELLDEIFGSENFRALIAIKKTAGLGTEGMPTVTDYILWYACDIARLKTRPLFVKQNFTDDPYYVWIMNGNGEKRRLTQDELETGRIPEGWKIFRHQIFLAAGRASSCIYEITFNGEVLYPNRRPKLVH